MVRPVVNDQVRDLVADLKTPVAIAARECAVCADSWEIAYHDGMGRRNRTNMSDGCKLAASKTAAHQHTCRKRIDLSRKEKKQSWSSRYASETVAVAPFVVGTASSETKERCRPKPESEKKTTFRGI